MSLGFSGQRGLHEVYTTIHDAPVRCLALCNILRVYATHWRSIVKAIYFKSAFSVKFWTYHSASSFKQAATVFLFGPPNFQVVMRMYVSALYGLPNESSQHTWLQLARAPPGADDDEEDGEEKEDLKGMNVDESSGGDELE